MWHLLWVQRCVIQHRHGRTGLVGLLPSEQNSSSCLMQPGAEARLQILHLMAFNLWCWDRRRNFLPTHTDLRRSPKADCS